MKSLSTWKLIYNSIQQQVPVMLLYVLESTGSSPGRQGFFMAVNLPGEMEGSLGGGIMEHKFVEMAKVRLQQHKEEALVQKQIHDKNAPRHQSGMICSGEQTILLFKVDEADKKHISNIIDCLENQQSGILQLSPAKIIFTNEIISEDYFFKKDNEEQWTYTEKIGYRNHLYIIGGGHCALALSKIMKMLDFYIHLFEDRKDLNTMLNNDFAHDKQLVPNYGLLSELIPEGENKYVVVMTFGYRTDYIALSSLLNKNFEYIGLLGSKNKVEKMFADLREEGVEEKVLEGIYAPVGLNIKSQTPEEIAISIAAEIIKIKNKAK